MYVDWMFGEALRVCREAKNVTQQDLGKSIGLSGGMPIYQWERGRYLPRPSQLRKIIDALELPDGAAGRLIGCFLNEQLRRDLARMPELSVEAKKDIHHRVACALIADLKE